MSKAATQKQRSSCPLGIYLIDQHADFLRHPTLLFTSAPSEVSGNTKLKESAPAVKVEMSGHAFTRVMSAKISGIAWSL